MGYAEEYVFVCVPGHPTLLTISIKAPAKGDLPFLCVLRGQSSGSCRAGSVWLLQHHIYLLNTHVSIVRMQGGSTGVNIAQLEGKHDAGKSEGEVSLGFFFSAKWFSTKILE